MELIFEYEEILITLKNLIDETANEIANELIHEKEEKKKKNAYPFCNNLVFSVLDSN